MHFETQGMSLWYGTPDAPASGETVQAGSEITITVGVRPIDASNRVELLYCTNMGTIKAVTAKWLRNDFARNAQYFRACLPAFRAGDKVEYIAICHCAGRQVPSPEDAKQFSASFRVIEAGTQPTPNYVSENTLLPEPKDSFSAQNDSNQSVRSVSQPIFSSSTLQEKTDVGDGKTAKVFNNKENVLQLQPQRFVVKGLVRQQEGNHLVGATVQAFDKDLRTQELLGKAITNAYGYYEICYTSDQFRRAEKGSADLSFQVFNSDGTEYTITDIIVNEASIPEPKIIFNASTEVCADLVVVPQPKTQLSEYERYVAILTPVLEDVSLASLTDEDVTFLVSETDIERQLIEWLRKSAQLNQQTNVPTEAFYGFARKDLPLNLDELLAHPLEELRHALEAAIEQNIIPASLRESLDRILTRLEQLKVETGILIAHRFIGKLLNRDTSVPLTDLTVKGFDLDAGSEPKALGYDITNTQGIFVLAYTTPRETASTTPATNDAGRRIRLQITLNPANNQTYETEVRAKSDNEILEIQVPVPAPEVPPEHELPNLANNLQLELPAELLSFLSDRRIRTLEDIRKAGGISQLEGLPLEANDPAIRILEAHADLIRVSPEVTLNKFLIEKNYDSVAAIARAARPDFVGAIRDRIGDFKAAQIQVAARTQTHFLNNLMFAMAGNHVNGFENNPMMAEQIRCRCRDCEAAVSPLSYLADLLKYVTENVKNQNLPIAAAGLAGIFCQPFDLPASCEAVDAQIRQVRLCVEVLRRFLGTRPLDAGRETKLASAEKDYLLAAYTILLTKIGTNYTEIRLSRTNEPSLRRSLADRLGIDLSHLNGLLLDPNPDPANPNPNPPLTEAALEQLFGLVDTTRNPFASTAIPELQAWRLEYLRFLWKAQDFPADGYEDGQNTIVLKQLPAGVAFPPPLDTKISYDTNRQQLVCKGEMTPDERSTLLSLSPDLSYQQAVKELFQISQRLPIIDPDLIGPDDFRRPFLKANPKDPQAFDLWKNRRDWVDKHLEEFASLKKTILVDKQPQRVPDIAAMFDMMYKPVTYGATSVIAWANTTPSSEFETLRNNLTQGIDVDAIKFRLLDDLHLPVENFNRLMAIVAKAKTWENDTRSEPVKDDEWREVYSILVQAQKVKLFATWRKQESDAGVQFDPQTFWISLRQPQEGEWPPILSDPTKVPLIDPSTLKLKDLPESVAGERAIALLQARQTRLKQIPQELADERQNNDFDAMLRFALGNPLPHDLNVLKSELSNPDTVASATSKITKDLHLTVDGFKRLLLIKAKNDGAPSNRPTAAEWAELYAILTPARVFNHDFRIWINEETGLNYWGALKAKLPRWRSSGSTRQLWQQALRSRSQSAIIDPDLIGPGDLKNPAPGDPAFDLWQARVGEINTQLNNWRQQPKTKDGLDTNFQSILGVSIVQFLAIADDQVKGHIISDRLAQLSLEVAEFNTLVRVANLAKQTQPILDLEWENVYSILVQVWKRRQAAKWRAVEKDKKLLLSSDFFQIAPPAPLQSPSKEQTVAAIWRSPKMAYLDWQERLQSRLDQEQTTIQAVAEAVSATEEATLPILRDALILAINSAGIVVTTPSEELEVKAEWFTQNLLIDAKMSGCSMTTRVAQAIETLQGLIQALRTGQLAELYQSFTLNLDNFEEKWKWIGSYPSWRGAMFVYLYPENLLLPSLRKLKTPAFEKLLRDIPSNRTVTASDACRKANEYAQYFQDICTLKIEATCTANTHLSRDEDDKCNPTENGYQCLFYTFARSTTTNTVYWSVHDPLYSSYKTVNFWDSINTKNEVKGITNNEVAGWENIIEVVGATPYKVSPEQRFIFLFARKREGNQIKLICAKYDLENPGWVKDSIPLDIGGDNRVVVKQQEDENEPPHLAYGPGGLGGYLARKLNKDGTKWEDEGAESTLMLFGVGKPVGMIAKDKDSFYLLYRDDIVTPPTPDRLYCDLYMNATVPRSGAVPFKDSKYKRVATHSWQYAHYNGVFSLPLPSPQGIGIFVLTFDPYTFDTTGQLWLIRDVGTPWLKAERFACTLADKLYSVAPESASFLDISKLRHKAFQKYPTSAILISPWLVPEKQPSVIEAATRVAVTPFLKGPFDIPGQLSATDLQIRKGLIQSAYDDNKNNSGDRTLIYLEEAYYFVNIYLALALQRSGDYIAALDRFRTAYDYTVDEKERKIYFGLVLEESLANTYKRSSDWLLDPLNPHAIAATRWNTYTRFTLLAIIRCLLDYADAEFTQDTPESNPRARNLYLKALELLEPKKKQIRNQSCDEIIGYLDDVEVPNDRWQKSLLQIKGALKAIPDRQRLLSVVNQIQQALTADAPIEQRFVEARAILNQAIAALPPAPNLTTVIEENENFSHAFQRSVLADSSQSAALEVLSTIATQDFQRAVSMVTGISPARLELRKIDLPWLREPIPLAVNPQDGQTGTNLAIVRRDEAMLDVLAPKYMTTLAHVAALQPMNAVNVSMQAVDTHIPQLIVGFCIPPNPLLKALRSRAELNLYKLRTCRNIAGLKRQLELYAAPTDTTTGLPTIGAGGQLLLPGVGRLQPTLYRYPVLIERAKQLVQLAGQIEAAFLLSLEKEDDEAFTLLKARQDLSIAQASVQLQKLRLNEANNGTKLAQLKKQRIKIQVQTYTNWIQAGLNDYEKTMINAYLDIRNAKVGSEGLEAQIRLFQAAIGVAGAGLGAGTAAAAASAMGLAIGAQGGFLSQQFGAETAAQIAAVNADLEKRKREWQFQLDLSNQDDIISDQEIILATDRVNIVTQEKVISELQSSNAKDTIEFLATKKFTSINLYEWMSGVLEGVYRFFLQQATSMAKLSENQLAFERQEVPPAYIQADYWNPPSNAASGFDASAPARDRRGLTGSARLLQDIYQLDQYAFNTNKRKLQLSKTFSLALLAPVEFQQFRETGVIIFTTPMELFDRDFPGHYLRLIRRVRTSVIALIPPTQGIHATLTTTGLSRTVIGPDIFQTVSIRRDPEFVALTSPINSTGMFELEPQQTEMLQPFEGNGVDSTWEFRMPKVSNQFDFRTISNVLITIEYTALNSFDYRQQVIQTLNPNLSADRPFSFRNQFADPWYDLNNPDQTQTPMKVKFQTFREDFPPNLEALKIKQILLYFVRASQNNFELPVTELRFTEQGNQGTVGGSATPIDGVISTRRGNGGSWTPMIGKSPVGEWELALPNTEEMKNRFKDEEIDDILFIITYSGRTPAWPM